MMRVFRITCREAQVLLSQRQDGQLRGIESLRLRLHLLVCSWCARVARHFVFLSQAARRLGTPPPRRGPP